MLKTVPQLFRVAWKDMFYTWFLLGRQVRIDLQHPPERAKSFVEDVDRIFKEVGWLEVTQRLFVFAHKTDTGLYIHLDAAPHYVLSGLPIFLTKLLVEMCRFESFEIDYGKHMGCSCLVEIRPCDSEDPEDPAREDAPEEVEPAATSACGIVLPFRKAV